MARRITNRDYPRAIDKQPVGEHPWPTPVEIIRGQARNSFNERWRIWSRFDFSDCKHENDLIFDVGGWEIHVCERCAATRKTCRHEKCEWDPSGTLLRCTNCGEDCT